MNQYYTIALDVGRTFIRSALIDERGHILPDSFSIFSSKLSESNETILKNFVKVIQFNINSVLHPNFKIKQIGFSLPVHEKKRFYLNENALKKLLQEESSVYSKLSRSYEFHFEENSRLFAIGENILREKPYQNKRVLYLIIGSSLSTSYMINGNFTNKYYDMFWDSIHEDRAIQNFISKEGIIEVDELTNFNNNRTSLKDFSKLITNKDKKAIKMYKRFGYNLGMILKDAIHSFAPDEIIIGGNVALSYPLFRETFEHTIGLRNVIIKPTEFTSYYIFLGFAEMIKNKNPKNN